MNYKKVWTNYKDKEDNFIVYSSSILYRIKVKTNQYQEIIDELNSNTINANFIGIPISYIKKIDFKETNSYLKLYYGKNSVDTIKISDKNTRKAIFDYLGKYVRTSRQEVIKSSFFRRTRKPLIAFILLIIALFFVMTIKSGLESSYEFEFATMSSQIIGGLLVAIANLDSKIQGAIFISLSLISLYRIIKLNQDNSDTYRIIYKE